MDVREKLVELILNADNDKNLGFYDLYDLTHERTGGAEYFADYLIANGVTVQEWISVKDRLPEQGEKAICIDADGDMMIGKYTEWGWMFPCYFEELTHWMPLPEMPKEN